ncbi:MAG TPA: helix-turn-helix transcriptional regulator [Candidatus Avoscillospira avistercoris]|uniref:Helix-turn-helix transcriptional regulator n=1 Tax=Candidatus Avoscillospira avistercoris TaxID=2840707 RepID=A0A9D1F8L1_9FIRM|nr:helix-turn-helix transcriptional regulator [Candidatus Avoscillospira avistercoris]
MSDKTTSDLRQELMEDNSIDTYLQGNAALFINQDVVVLLTELYEQKHLTKAALARQAGMSEVYLHQVFAGRRNPSRDRLLCLCIGLEATVEETQQLLRQAGYAQLYPRVRRDAIILHAIAHGIALPLVNDKLYEENEKTLF